CSCDPQHQPTHAAPFPVGLDAAYTHGPAGVMRVPCIHDGIPGGGLYGTPPFGGNPGGGLGVGNTPAGMFATWRSPPVTVYSQTESRLPNQIRWESAQGRLPKWKSGFPALISRV